MGRWESTRKIKPFQGVYIYGHRVRNKTDDDRIKEIQQKKQEDLADDDYASASTVEMQNITDEYSVPKTQAEMPQKSVAEQIDEEPKQQAKVETEEIRQEADAVKQADKKKYNPNKQSSSMRAYNTALKGLPKQDGQNNRWLTTLAEQVGVGWGYDSANRLRFTDARMDLTAGYLLNAKKDGVFQASTGELKAMIRDAYLKSFRDPEGFGVYDLFKKMVIEHYELEETMNADGKPIGNYKKYLKLYDEVYDGYRNEDKYPTADDVISAMDELIANTKMSSEQKKRQRKTQYQNSKNKPQTPAEKLYDTINPVSGLIY